MNEYKSLENKNEFLHDIYHFSYSRLCSISFDENENDENYLKRILNELFYWDKIFNERYVYFIENEFYLMNSNLFLLNQNDIYKRKEKNFYIPSHIYRQLSLHEKGFHLLKSYSHLKTYANQIKQYSTNSIDYNQSKLIKTCLWALGNVASTNIGICWFIENDLLIDFLRFAEESEILSIRG